VVTPLDDWLKPALDYIPQWLDHQMRLSEQPGCVTAIVHKGSTVFEQAFGYADIAARMPLTPRHRFRVASHSKSFTAAGILKLREQRKLSLDDRVGQYVQGLHPAVAEATIAQLLSHSGGIIRDGTDSGQWMDRRPFLDAAELRAELAMAPVIDPNIRFKYSNHGYGLLGFVIEAMTGTSYLQWIRSEIVEPARIEETEPDMPVAAGVPVARGHSAKLPLGRRVVIPGDNPTNALASATGFVSTARDLANFFAQLDPGAKESMLSVDSRREMVHERWRYPQSSVERHYALGITTGNTAGWEWFGHGGSFQGFASRTAVLPGRALTVSLVTNAVDGPANRWMEGMIQILANFAKYGAPNDKVRDWTGRWWTLWGAVDLVPMGEKVFVADPALDNPFMETSEISIDGDDRGRFSLAPGLARHAEGVRRIRDDNRMVKEVWLGGVRMLPEAEAAIEIEQRYGA